MFSNYLTNIIGSLTSEDNFNQVAGCCSAVGTADLCFNYRRSIPSPIIVKNRLESIENTLGNKYLSGLSLGNTDLDSF